MSTLNKLFNSKAIIFNLKATSKEEVLKEIAAKLTKEKFVNDEKAFLQALKDRESQFSTGIGGGLGIPHAQSKHVEKNVVLIAKSKKGIEWNSMDDKPVHTIFSIALSEENANQQVEVLADLSKMMMDSEFIKNLNKSKNKTELFKVVSTYETKKQETKVISGAKNIVAITACPTGIAHTYMAAEYLEDAAKNLKYNIKVETQGRQTEGVLTQEDIDAADVIILAVDKGIDGMSRFNGRNVKKVGTKAVIADAPKVINEGLEEKGTTKISVSDSGSNNAASTELEWNAFKNVYKNLMGGVSRMLPFVVAGGILIGLAFLLDSGVVGGNLGVTRNISRWFAGLGKVTFGIFVPVLGAYVAYSIVGPEGLLPGFVAGLIASGGGILYGVNATGGHISTGWSDLWGSLTPGVPADVLQAGSGFIGTMVGGYVAALAVFVLRKYAFAKVNKTFRGVVSIIAMPLLSVIITGTIMFALQIPLAYFAYGLKLGLTSLGNRNLLWLVGLVVGFMMALDMGGPVNKAAYVFATGLLQNGSHSEFVIMAEVMIAGMVPPMAITFSTLVFRDKAWTKKEQIAAYPNWLLGLFFITEGAIPFAAKDPKRVIPSIIIGSMVAGLIIGLTNVGVNAPHGGIFVFALLRTSLFASQGASIGMAILFAFLALVAGTVSGGMVLGLWRKIDVKRGKLKLAQ
ncbi:PTS fructose transporter subunit IIABC [Mycoplasma marinum]|uniref:PTS fructose transporter subunit IIABC n=1 Tax=Mycoplasma marinum TaxID=1937190 RepID=A0A4R0XNC6_9MOLU|nr:fructose-specific PTS transporter subunit EIIC [Mycoplasma marinum]TCG10982.1 PTS fructose transporter subunit IIABC [Mycoplasma marinum]